MDWKNRQSGLLKDYIEPFFWFIEFLCMNLYIRDLWLYLRIPTTHHPLHRPLHSCRTSTLVNITQHALYPAQCLAHCTPHHITAHHNTSDIVHTARSCPTCLDCLSLPHIALHSKTSQMRRGIWKFVGSQFVYSWFVSALSFCCFLSFPGFLSLTYYGSFRFFPLQQNVKAQGVVISVVEDASVWGLRTSSDTSQPVNL